MNLYDAQIKLINNFKENNKYSVEHNKKRKIKIVTWQPVRKEVVKAVIRGIRNIPRELRTKDEFQVHIMPSQKTQFKLEKANYDIIGHYTRKECLIDVYDDKVTLPYEYESIFLHEYGHLLLEKIFVNNCLNENNLKVILNFINQVQSCKPLTVYCKALKKRKNYNRFDYFDEMFAEYISMSNSRYINSAYITCKKRDFNKFRKLFESFIWSLT